MGKIVRRASDESPLWGVIPYEVAVPVLLASALGLTVLLVVTLESWHSAIIEAISMGAHPQDIPRPDLLKVGSLALLLGATTLVSVYILQYYRNTQRQLARVQQLSRNVLDNIATGVLTLDAEGVVSMANPSVCQILCRPPLRPGVDLRWLALHYPSLEKIVRSTLENVEYVQGQDALCVTSEGDNIWLRITTTPMPMPDPQQVGVIVLINDVTQQLAYEKQLRRLDRLAVTESLAAGVAHEIRNPLTAIDLNLRTLRNEVSAVSPDQEEVSRHFEILTEETRRLNRITEEFLNFSRRSSAPLRHVSVSKVVVHVLDLIAPEIAGRRIQVETAIAQDPGTVLGDEERLEQVILNILVNAMEAMPDGGEIKVTVERPKPPKRHWVEVSVADRGPGVPEKNLARLFDPYFTTKKSGSGLGLAIAHRIVTDHDGEIGVENAAEGGVIVRIRLPVPPAELSPSERSYESQTSAS